VVWYLHVLRFVCFGFCCNDYYVAFTVAGCEWFAFVGFNNVGMFFGFDVCLFCLCLLIVCVCVMWFCCFFAVWLCLGTRLLCCELLGCDFVY